MTSTKKTIRDFLFRIKPVHFIATLIAGLGLIVFLGYNLLSKFAAGHNALIIILLLSFFFLVSRMSVLSSVGIGFLILIMFGVMIAWGWFVNLLVIWFTTIAAVYLSRRSTPIDFAINKNIANYLAQGVYLSLWTFTMIIFFKLFSISYIMSHLTIMYMITVIIYIIFMVICLPTLAQRLLPEVLINGLVMLPFQWVLVVFFGRRFLEYMLTFL